MSFEENLWPHFTQLTFFIYKSHHSNEEEASIIVIFIILQFTAIPLLFLVCVTWFVFVCGVYLYDACNPSFTKEEFCALGCLTFPQHLGICWVVNNFHIILCISIFVGCSIIAQHIVHLGSTCWVLNFAQQFVHLGIYWCRCPSENPSL